MIASLLAPLVLFAAAPQDAPGAAGFDPLASRLAGAQAAYAAGELETARELLAAAVAETPGEPEPRLWLARVHNDLGDGTAAEEVLNPALIALPEAPRLLVESGRALALQGETELAESVLRQALERYPRSGPARLELADLLLDAGRAAEAETTLGPLLEQAPEEPAVVVAMARALDALGRRGDAIALLASRVVPEGTEPALRLALARLRLDAGEPDAAWEAAAPVAATSRDPRELLFVARLAGGADRPLDAVAVLGAALLVAPDDPDVLAELARVLQAADLGARIAARRIATRPEDVESWRGVLEAHLAAGRLAELEADWARMPAALRAEPGLAVVRASAQRRAGETDAARTELRRLADEHDLARAWYELGLLEYAAGEPAAAAEAFANGAEGPWAADAHFNRGVCLDRLGRHAEAVAAYEAAIAARPDHAAAYKQIGDGWRWRLGDAEKARTAYRRFLELGGDDAEVRRFVEGGR